MRKRVEVKAVWDADLEGLLESLGVLDTVRSGSATCAVCGRFLTLDDIAAIRPSGDGVVTLICDNGECISSIAVLPSVDEATE